jgi:hypothetical protein
MYRDATIYLERKYERYCIIKQSHASERWRAYPEYAGKP